MVGARIGTEERVHAVLVLDEGADVDAIVRQANAELDDHQKIRRALVWPERGAAAHRRHAQTEASRRSRLGRTKAAPRGS